MKSKRMLILIMLLLCSFGVGAQGAYLEKGVNGVGSEARIAFGIGGFQGFEVVSGYSIAGILDLGGSIGTNRRQLSGYPSTDLRAAFDFKLNVLKQAAGIPLSLQILGSYGLDNVFSEYLEINDATRRGTGYTLGLNLASNIRLAPSWLIRVSLFGGYDSINYSTIEPIIPTPPPENPQTFTTVERVTNLYLGGALGFMVVFPHGAIFTVLAELRADQDLEFQINPTIAVTFPQR